MSDFSAFLAQNKIKHEDVKYIASYNFVDKNGKPMEWTLRGISSAKDDAIRKSCTKQVQVKVAGRTNSNQFRAELDSSAYMNKLITATIIFPDLNNKEIQDSYGVMGAEELLLAMLSPGEYADLANKVTEVNGFETGDINNLVDDAKK